MTQASERITSYAQNAEDIVLWRGLSHVERGTYIDVGAAHPLVDNVTQLFYEKGWSGINIEPDPVQFELLARERKRDVNLNMGAGNSRGELVFFRFPETGFSTFDQKQADIWRREGFAFEKLRRPIGTLDEMIETAGLGEIHFLKIDVEGFERQVLEGLDLRKRRPWIIVVEATAPQTNNLVADKWEDILLAADYRRCLFDGINLFYCAAEHPDIARRISHPANVVDNYHSATLAELARQLQHKDRLIDTWQSAFAFEHQEAAAPRPAQRPVKPLPTVPADGRTPKLFVDVTYLKRTLLVTGIQRVALNIAACLKRLSAESGFDIVFTVFDDSSYRHVEFNLSDDAPSVAEFGALGEPIWLRKGDQWLSCELNSFDIVPNFDWYRRVKEAGVTLNFWVYDLFPVMRPDWSPPVEILRYRAWWERISVLADRIICDSAKVAREVESWMSLFPSPLSTEEDQPLVYSLHLGADGMDNVRLASARQIEFARPNPACRARMRRRPSSTSLVFIPARVSACSSRPSKYCGRRAMRSISC